VTSTVPTGEKLLVTGLDDVGGEDVAVAGGKGANLGELLRAGFPVPPGFLVSTAAYTTAVRDGGLAAAIADGLATGDGAAIRAAFAATPIPEAVRAEIVDAYAGLGGGPVAVRSSATAEDLPGAAFAGQQDTYLNVVGEAAVLDAVRRCWGSLWTDRAIAYRRRRGVDATAVRIAVVVQQMVDAEFAGVLFTANPVTGERNETVVDAGAGLGEAVVSGMLTPDHYVLGPDGTVRERRRGAQEVVLRPGAAGGVVRSGEVRSELPERVLRELAALGRSVAAHFGGPQDVEWAYADGRLRLVQARPMTALPPPPLRLGRAQRRLGLQLLDYVSVRPYPLDMTAWVGPGIGRLVERMLAEIAGLRVDLTAMLPERDGVVDRFVPLLPRPTPAMLRVPGRLARRLRRYRVAFWTDDPRLARFLGTMDALDGNDPTELPWPELFGSVHRALAAADLVADLRVDYLSRVGVDLLVLRAVLVPLRAGDLFRLLVLGARTRTDDANRALEDLAERVRVDPELRRAVEELPPEAVLDRVAAEPRFAEFHRALIGFLAEYGHRETSSPLVVSAPTWRDAPATVVGLLRVLLDEPRRAARPDRAAAEHQRLLDHRLVRLTRTAGAVTRLVGAVQAGIALREDTHFHLTRAVPVLRRALLEAGRRLAAAGVLDEADDVFHLRLEELEAVPDATAIPPRDADRLRALVRQRAARRAELAGVPLISAATLRDAPTGEVLVSGVAAGGGRATGPVRVIRDPSGFGSLRSGDVLVCPFTNPAWTPLFQRAAAVVVDSGGAASHAAIVAREYGIPAVMGCGTATAVLTDGQRVTVDGDAGRVAPAADG
jgi:pyruvate,water dikinase